MRTAPRDTGRTHRFRGLVGAGLTGTLAAMVAATLVAAAAATADQTQAPTYQVPGPALAAESTKVGGVEPPAARY